MATRITPPRPGATEARIKEVEARLRAEYGQPRHHNPKDPLDDLIFLMLSRMTQEVKYVRTYELLRDRYPTWDEALRTGSSELADVLRDAGLADTKATQVQGILREIQEREGALDLSRLKDMPNDEVEHYLTSLPGVAAKTARSALPSKSEERTGRIGIRRLLQRLLQRVRHSDECRVHNQRPQSVSQSVAYEVRDSRPILSDGYAGAAELHHNPLGSADVCGRPKLLTAWKVCFESLGIHYAKSLEMSIHRSSGDRLQRDRM